jgi:hypothetical protein
MGGGEGKERGKWIWSKQGIGMYRIQQWSLLIRSVNMVEQLQ